MPTTPESLSTGYRNARKVPSSEHAAACCGARFGGLNTAHCAGCHQTFTGMTAFDKHRQGIHAYRRICRAAESVGLVDAGRAYPCWGSPSDNDWYGIYDQLERKRDERTQETLA